MKTQRSETKKQETNMAGKEKEKRWEKDRRGTEGKGK